MTALPDLNVTGAVVGQTFSVDFRNNIVSATLGQQYGDASDMLLIYNLSPCNFSVMLTATNRTFNLPAGVTSNPIPLSYRGTSDTGLKLTVKSLIVTGAPNVVSFDWFRPGEPILAAPATNIGLGSVSLSSISASSIVFPSPNNWIIQQDGSGNLDITDVTDANTWAFDTTGATVFPSAIASIRGQTTVGPLGVPANIGQTLHMVVNTTSTHMASYTAPVSDSLLRATGYVLARNGTLPMTISMSLTWTDRTTGLGASVSFMALNSTVQVILNSASISSSPVFLTCFSFMIDVQGGTTPGLSYTNFSGTPNDVVSVVLERVS